MFPSHDRQGNGANPVIGDIIQNGATYFFTDYLAKDDTKRFKILADLKIVLDDYGEGNTHYVEKYVDLKGMNTVWNGSSAGISNINTNAIGMMFIGSEATNTPTLYYSSRLDFIDL